MVILGGLLAARCLIAQAGRITGLADTRHIFRPQSILRGMGADSHFPAAVRREITARNRMAAWLATLDNDDVAAIFAVSAGAHFVKDLRQITHLPRFVQDGKASGALLSSHFRELWVVFGGGVWAVTAGNADAL